MTALHREDLERQCKPPVGSPTAPPRMFAPCHSSQRLLIEFDASNGDLVISCGICRAPVARVAVAAQQEVAA